MRHQIDKKAVNARNRVNTALKKGILVKPKNCQVCWCDPSEIETCSWHKSDRHKSLIAHHWNGYDKPLDVWWICYSCNAILTGRHDGSLKNVTEAFYFVSQIPIERIPDEYKHVKNLPHLSILNVRQKLGIAL